VFHLIDPRFSEVPTDEAESFIAAARPLLDIVGVADHTTVESILAWEPTAADAVIFFNPLAEEEATEFERVLERTRDAGAVILPIALRAEWRRPPGTVGEFQSFDVVDQRRLRELSGEQVEAVARAFARKALGQVQPTYSKDRLRLFLCHRREDGEELVARIGTRLDALHEGHVFRDLIEVQVGERAQDRIEEALEGADVLVFIDTPLAGESWWVAHEISAALGRNIPIVWVRVGSEEGREPLPCSPPGSPHLELGGTYPRTTPLDEICDQIVNQAFELSRAQVRVSAIALSDLRSWAMANDAVFERLDARRMIYELRRPAVPRGYPLRPGVDIIQMFARHPDQADRERLEQFLNEQGMGPHERECRSFDAALMLDPTATGMREVGEWSVIEHPRRFLASLPSPQPAQDPAAQQLLLLGAFPSEEEAVQEVVQAVHAVSTTWLRLGGSIVFGGHPTFTPLLAEAARLVVPGREAERVTVYQSRWFASPSALQELEGMLTVVATEAAKKRNDSLTIMRSAMCGLAANAVIAIGGRTAEGGTHEPGIDQELALARAAGSPAYLLGATGGRTAELAAEARLAPEPWETLANGLSVDQNEELFQSDDYEGAARLIYGHGA
jgi:hypothetical protein